jgi:hypothetical protein
VTVCLPYKNVGRTVCRCTHRRHTNGGTAILRGNSGQRFLGNLVPLFLWQRFSDFIKLCLPSTHSFVVYFTLQVSTSAGHLQVETYSVI